MHNPYSRNTQYLGCELTPVFHVTKTLVKTHLEYLVLNHILPGMASQVTLFTQQPDKAPWENDIISSSGFLTSAGKYIIPTFSVS